MLCTAQETENSLLWMKWYLNLLFVNENEKDFGQFLFLKLDVILVFIRQQSSTLIYSQSVFDDIKEKRLMIIFSHIFLNEILWNHWFKCIVLWRPEYWMFGYVTALKLNNDDVMCEISLGNRRCLNVSTGVDNFYDALEDMMGYRPNAWMKWSWTVITPLLCMVRACFLV